MAALTPPRKDVEIKIPSVVQAADGSIVLKAAGKRLRVLHDGGVAWRADEGDHFLTLTLRVFMETEPAPQGEG